MEYSTLLLFSGLGWQEIVLILLVVLLLFGAKRIPEIARSLGKGVKEFKKGISDGGEEKEEENKSQPRRDDQEKAEREEPHHDQGG